MNALMSRLRASAEAAGGCWPLKPDGHGHPPTPVKGAPRTRIRILYAEDDASLRRAGELILASAGYAVVTAADGAEARSHLEWDHFDLLITDNNMPHLSGLELIRELGRARVDIPIIMASGSVAEMPEEDRRRIERCGAVLPKPFAPEHLIATVNQVLRTASKGSSATQIGPSASITITNDRKLRPHSRWGINE